MYAHEDTIGTVEHDGKTYEIDWPHDVEDSSKRDIFGVIYLDGEQVGEVSERPGQKWECEDDVLEAARELIEEGETDDQ